jgi:hypothetical protein
MVVLRNGIEPLLASHGGDRLAFPKQLETQHIKPGEGERVRKPPPVKGGICLLTHTRVKNDKAPRASYSFKGSYKTSCVHYKPCQVVKSNK